MTRTPDEIKKGLEYISIKDVARKLDAWEDGIPYDYVEDAAADALALVQQLQAENAALLFQCEQYGKCVICKYADKGTNESPCCDCLNCNGDATGSHWQWRGVQKG